MVFKDIRLKALTLWQERTGRICHAWGDDLNDSYECDWQVMNDAHVSIFCSLGVWASCFSQLLRDERYDEIDLENRKDYEALYLYYNQVLLVISEILNDLERMYRQAVNVNSPKARTFLSGSATYSISEVQGFINNVVKHKAEDRGSGSFHSCNHHLLIRYEDAPKTRKGPKTLYVGNISNLSERKSILMPSLICLIELIVLAYEHMDQTFIHEPESYRNIAAIYEKV